VNKMLEDLATIIALDGPKGNYSVACTAALGYFRTHHAEIAQNAEAAKKWGELVITTNETGNMVLASRQDSEGRIIEVLGEAAAPSEDSKRLKALEQAMNVIMPEVEVHEITGLADEIMRGGE